MQPLLLTPDPPPDPGTGRGVRPSVGRSLGTVAVFMLVLPFAIWAIVRVFGLESGTPWVQLVAFTPYVACAAAGPLVLAVVLRRWWGAGVAALVCVMLLASVTPRMVPFGGADATAGPLLRVLSLNMYEGQADVEQIMRLIRDHDVDVVAFQEFTPRAERRLEEAGLAELLPYSGAHAERGVDGSAVYSRHPISDDDVKINPGGFLQAAAVVDVPGVGAVTVESVHPVSPSDERLVGLWAEGLRGQAPATDDERRVLIGDFNATLDHVELRRILDTGYRDAAAEVGRGLVPTWPFGGAEYRLIPKVTIDHALISANIGAEAFTAFTIDGTDHRAILATLVLPVA